MIEKMIRLVILLFMGLFACTVAAREPSKVVCYVTNWTWYRKGNGHFDISETDPRLCTHIIYAFAKIDGHGNLASFDPQVDLGTHNGYGKVNELRKRNPSLKTLLAVGGWTMSSAPLSGVAASADSRRRFATGVVDFLKKYGFDGFDVDWEYPNQREDGRPEDKQNFVLLLEELSRQLKPEGMLLSAAVAATRGSASKSYDIRRMVPYLDFINLMAYDLHGAWDGKTGINAPLYAGSWEVGAERELNVDASVEYWLSQGAPPDKLIVGIPFYGRGFTIPSTSSQKGIGITGSTTSNPGPYSGEAGYLAFNEICEKQMTSWTKEFQPDQRVPYTYGDGNQWVGYDDERSIRYKVNYVKEKKLGGIMAWSIDQDDFKGTCGKRYPLLTAINEALGSISNEIDTGAGNTHKSRPTNQRQVLPVTQTPKYVNNFGGSNSNYPNGPGVTDEGSGMSAVANQFGNMLNRKSNNPWKNLPTAQTPRSVNSLGGSNSKNFYGPGTKVDSRQKNPRVPGLTQSGQYPEKSQNSLEKPCEKVGVNRHPSQCNAFYHCEIVDGVFKSHHTMTCPLGLNFDPVMQNCNWPAFVKC